MYSHANSAGSMTIPLESMKQLFQTFQEASVRFKDEIITTGEITQDNGGLSQIKLRELVGM